MIDKRLVRWYAADPYGRQTQTYRRLVDSLRE